MLVDVAYHL